MATYETTTSRLKTVTDPKGQVTTYTYNLDDTVQQVAYTNAAIATPSVSYTYDANYPRVVTMVDGTGTTTYGYHAAGELGAGQVASVDGPLTDDTITYTYDELGRVASRAINGVALTQAYDALGRVTGETNVLGTFTYGYDGVTRRLASVTYPNGQTSAYAYLDNAGDRRLQTIHHKYPDGSTLSKFDYTYDAAGNILTFPNARGAPPPRRLAPCVGSSREPQALRQQADATAVLWTYGYDPADQLTAAVKASDSGGAVLQRYAYAYDPAGNRTSEQIDDAVTKAAYDPLNRLVSQDAGGPLVFKGQLDEPAAVTINGRPATVATGNTFQGTSPVAAGTTTVTIDAVDPSGNTATAVMRSTRRRRGKRSRTTRMGISPATPPERSSGMRKTNWSRSTAAPTEVNSRTTRSIAECGSSKRRTARSSPISPSSGAATNPLSAATRPVRRSISFAMDRRRAAWRTTGRTISWAAPAT